MARRSLSSSSPPAARPGELPVSGYERLAAEYYDASRHPTCANLREGSRILLAGWLGAIDAQGLTLCDLGAGKSLLAEIVAPGQIDFSKLFLVDSSLSMLSYSKDYGRRGANLILGDASNIPVPSKSIDVLMSSLGDPYNVDAVWAEIGRVVQPGGRVFFTTPAYEWATGFRTTHDEDLHLAEFELADGGLMYVPSYVFPVSEQIEMVERHGLAVESVSEVPLSALGDSPISPKLLSLRERDGAVVTGFSLTLPK